MKIRKRRAVIAFVLLIILLLVFLVFLEVLSVNVVSQRHRDQNIQKLAGITQELREVDSELNEYADEWIQKNGMVAALMAASLRFLTDGESYTGPEIFDDGVVVRIEDDRIIYPADFTGYIKDLGPEDAEYVYNEGYLFGSSEEDGVHVFYVLRRIAGRYYYLDWTLYEEYEQDMEDINRRLNESLLNMEYSYGGYFLVVSRNEGSLLYASDSLGEFDEDTTIEDIGLTLDDLNEEKGYVGVNGKNYVASYRSMRFMGNPAKVIILIDDTSAIMDITIHNAVMIFLVFLLVTGLILWQYWVRSYVQDHELTQSEYDRYLPRRVRLMSLAAVLTGAVAIFFIVTFYQSMRNLSREAGANEKSIENIASYVEKARDEKSLYQIDAESWTTYYSERIAGLMEADPAMRTQEVLSAINQIIGSEYIMLFDEKGDEIVSSNSYAGFKLGPESGESAADFSRLLLGVDTIVHSPAEDPVTKKDLQQTGSRVDLGGKKFGALIVSFNSQESWEGALNQGISNFINRVTPSGKLCIIVLKANGLVVFSTDEDVIPTQTFVQELDTGGRVLSDMDIFTIDGVSYYGPFSDDDPYIYYYLTREDQIEKNSTLSAFVLIAGYLIIALIIILVMLIGYRSKTYKESVKLISSSHGDSVMDKNRSMADDDDIDVSAEGIRDWWRKQVPENRIRIYMQVTAGLLLLLLAFQLLAPSAQRTHTTIGFVLRGNWKRGLNLVAMSAISLIVTGYIIFLFVKTLVVGFLVNVLEPRGVTILYLIVNMIQSLGVVGLIFASLNYLGINTTVMLAGFSAFSLAVSLGGKELVADILAGFFIVFEDEFHVGDFIEINGYRGIVQEIGVRSTKLLGLGDNVKIFGNQSVKNVLNMSKMNSWYSLEFKMRTGQSLSEIEDILKRELPAIGKAIPEIISGPYYKGVWQFSADSYTLSINCECKEDDIRIVQRDLNHELLMLFEKNGLKIGY